MSDAANTPAPLPRPGVRERLLYGIPLVMFFASVACVLLITEALDDSPFALGPAAPLPARMLLRLYNTVARFPYVLTPAMFLVAWFYLTWGCKTRRRMRAFVWTTTMLALLILGFAFLAVIMVAGNFGPLQKL